MRSRFFPILVCLAAPFIFPGCASSTKSAKSEAAKVDWRERVGVYTYDQAVAELGKPAVIGESNDGKTAEWVLRRSPRMSFGFGVGSGSYGSHGGMGVGVGSSAPLPEHGSNLRLTFDEAGKLKDWSRTDY